MTQAELDALPEDCIIDYQEVRDKAGQVFFFPKFRIVESLCPVENEPGFVRDNNRQGWIIGWAHGVLWKRRIVPPIVQPTLFEAGES